MPTAHAGPRIALGRIGYPALLPALYPPMLVPPAVYQEVIYYRVNAAVVTNRPVQVQILPHEEAFQIPDLIRTKINLPPEHISAVRTVNIVGLDLPADGGTHIAHTGEVGRVVLRKTRSKGANNKRIIIALE